MSYIKHIQASLNGLGYYLKADGILGENTLLTVKQFRKDNRNHFDSSINEAELLTLEFNKVVGIAVNRELDSQHLSFLSGGVHQYNSTLPIKSVTYAIKACVINSKDYLFNCTSKAPRRITPNLLASSILTLSVFSDFLILAHFISQCAHESDRFRALEEYTNRDGSIPKHWNRYRGGAWMHGRGIIQLTHASNYGLYRDFCKRESIPFGGADDLVTDLNHAVRSSMWYWKSGSAWGDISRYAATDDPIAVTMAINGGFNGLKDRIRLLNKVKLAVGLPIETRYYLKNSHINKTKQKPRFLKLFPKGYVNV
jgi:predicted chitinase